VPSIHPNPLYSQAEIETLACSKCGNPMRLSQIEPAAPGYDIRTFECLRCNSSERFRSSQSRSRAAGSSCRSKDGHLCGLISPPAPTEVVTGKVVILGLSDASAS
jgi:hypothetical protein